MFKILVFFTTCAGIGTGIKTGLTSISNMDDDNNSLVNMGIILIVHCFFWTILYTLPIYLLRKFWWIAVIIIVIGVIVYFSKKGR